MKMFLFRGGGGGGGAFRLTIFIYKHQIIPYKKIVEKCQNKTKQHINDIYERSCFDFRKHLHVVIYICSRLTITK